MSTLSKANEGTAPNTAIANRRGEMRIRDLVVELVSISALKPYERNAHTHSKKQIKQIANSINLFGWTNPILIGPNGEIIAGHGRAKAAELLGIDHVPTIRIANMTEAQRRAYILADNKLAEQAGWNRELLAIELRDLIDMNLDLEIEIPGMEMAEIDNLIEEFAEETDDDELERLPETDPTIPPIVQRGDLWQLDRHRLCCDDATNPASFQRLMGGELAEAGFTDPPYNRQIRGVSGLGSHKHPEFAMASGEMSETEYVGFLKTVLGSMAAHSRDGSIHFVCIDWRHAHALLTAGRTTFDELKNICAWVKTNGGMGSLYRSQHELVCVFKRGAAAHINNIELGRHGRNRTNVWNYGGMNTFGAERNEALAMHPTVKPVTLIKDAIRDCSNRNGIVLDAFVGAGSTLIAAHCVGRRAFGLEIEPRYVEIALRRFHALTGIEPVHVDSGLKLSEIDLKGRSKSETEGGACE